MISLAQWERLKGATRQLIAAAGGIDAVGAQLKLNRSHVSRFQTVDSPEFISIAKVIALEGLPDVPPYVTRSLAAIAGHVLVERPNVDDAGMWGRALGDLAREVGDVMQALGTALGDDGNVNAAEVRRLQLVEQADEALNKLATLRAMLVRVTETALPEPLPPKNGAP